ncbi:hypothetical protein BX661DRAFT_189292 [Kickxella alabastrina]|uniref:uncharacterized protein n=1 Tax=Kickxella alabastrina TaxID=61397 RepID=UPI00222074C8|nr:uncharacterized protein BX661DRAFT_189292 [Kickxella alabastrina]KAI7820344.1 hypothetical protein BX661DRAFT_189292 [Kickxella alabastrina]
MFKFLFIIALNFALAVATAINYPTGLYRRVIIDSAENKSNSTNDVSAGLIAGVTVAVILGLLLLSFGVTFLISRYSRKKAANINK